MKKDTNITDEVLQDIEQRVTVVRGCLRQSTSAWLEVARHFAKAKDELKQIAFERFINDVGVTRAISDKLVIVGRREILFDSSMIEYISTAEGWTVLYALTQLTDKQIEDVVSLLKNDPSRRLTRDLIHNVANNRPLDERSIVLASIEIDSSKLKTITQVQLDVIASKLSEIDHVLSDANTLVSYRQRSKSVTKVENAAQANSCFMAVKTAA